jgi:hypothetical protein
MEHFTDETLQIVCFKISKIFFESAETILDSKSKLISKRVINKAHNNHPVLPLCASTFMLD